MGDKVGANWHGVGGHITGIICPCYSATQPPSPRSSTLLLKHVLGVLGAGHMLAPTQLCTNAEYYCDRNTCP